MPRAVTASRTRPPASGQSGQSAPEPVTPAAVLVLLAGIERHDTSAPAAVAFRSALRRKGIEADQAGGLAALDALIDAVADDDPTWADARLAILRGAWADLLPGS